MGVHNSVTTFTASDFGRTLTSNGQGSDHAWCGNHMVMGGINGRKVYGDFPALYEDNPLDTGRGRLIPTIACDEYFAELALWFGVAPSELATVFPNIGRFYDPISAADAYWLPHSSLNRGGNRQPGLPARCRALTYHCFNLLNHLVNGESSQSGEVGNGRLAEFTTPAYLRFL